MRCKVLVIFSCFCLASGCKPEVKSGVIEAAVAQNLASYRAKKHQECFNVHLEKANKLADSIMLAEAKTAILTQDSLIPPVKPTRPGKINPSSAIDTVAVKPMF
jgi:hypothetical protein